MLFVIFVFALIPAGFSQTRIAGSAFDPSNSVVSLKESTRQAVERKAMIGSDGGEPAVAAPIAMAPAAVSKIGERAPAPQSRREAQPGDGSLASSIRARAPPIA